MPKKRTYTIPVTLRLSPGMAEYVDGQAQEKGITSVDWIRQAISFTYWEKDWVQQQVKKHKERPINYLKEFEKMCRDLDDPESQLSREQQYRLEVLRRKGFTADQS
jgi:hypothetical protein